MKIVVLAGGLSTERDVSLASGAGICRTLRENGHDAFLLDVYLGFPYDSDKLEEVFTLPGAGLEIAEGIKTTALCGLGQTAPNPVLSTLRYFRDEYVAHVVD